MGTRSWSRIAVLSALTALPTWANINMKSCAPALATAQVRRQNLLKCAITADGQSQLFTFAAQASDPILTVLVNLNNSKDGFV